MVHKDDKCLSNEAENHAYTVALHVICYNFCRIHMSLRMSLAMRAGVSENLRDVVDLVGTIKEWEGISSQAYS